MRTERVKVFGIMALLALCAAAVGAQQPPVVSRVEPRITNAKVETRSAAAGLEREFRALVAAQEAPAWIGYNVPVLSEHQMCCWNAVESYRGAAGCCGECRLEGKNDVRFSNAEGPRSVKLEGPYHMSVLFRVEHKAVEKIRTFSEECPLDAGGLRVVWLADVKPAESVALLASFVRSDGASVASSEKDEDKPAHRHADSAIGAIAFHADPAADVALESFIAPAQSEWLRGQTAFWLGSARGRRGYEVLKRMAREEKSERVRDKVVFALSVSKDPEAVETMIAMARDDSSTRVRGQALFWLAQKAGKRAAAAITAAIENDPETEVKKKAVFALSQLPKDEGVPMLIQVAKTNKNPAVRKQAVFWLGQSNDARALAFFEEILKR